MLCDAQAGLVVDIATISMYNSLRTAASHNRTVPATEKLLTPAVKHVSHILPDVIVYLQYPNHAFVVVCSALHLDVSVGFVEAVRTCQCRCTGGRWANERVAWRCIEFRDALVRVGVDFDLLAASCSVCEGMGSQGVSARGVVLCVAFAGCKVI